MKLAPKEVNDVARHLAVVFTLTALITTVIIGTATILGVVLVALVDVIDTIITLLPHL